MRRNPEAFRARIFRTRRCRGHVVVGVVAVRSPASGFDPETEPRVLSRFDQNKINISDFVANYKKGSEREN